MVDYGVLFWINLLSSSAFMIMIIIMIMIMIIYYYYYRAASSYVQSDHKSPLFGRPRNIWTLTYGHS